MVVVNELASRGKRYIPGPQVDRRYNISAMTRWRWGQNAELDFPQPLRVNGRLFFGTNSRPGKGDRRLSRGGLRNGHGSNRCAGTEKTKPYERSQRSQGGS